MKIHDIHCYLQFDYSLLKRKKATDNGFGGIMFFYIIFINLSFFKWL